MIPLARSTPKPETPDHRARGETAGPEAVPGDGSMAESGFLRRGTASGTRASFDSPAAQLPGTGIPGNAPVVRPRGSRRSGRNVLAILAAMLALSAGLRLGTGIGTALAQDQRPEAPAPVPASAEQGATDLAAAVGLMSELQTRERQLEAREAALADRLQALAVSEDRIREHLAALEDAEERLEATLARVTGASEADITRLVAVYEAMRPEQAAALFAEMAPEFAAGFLARMRPEAAAAVLAGLEPRTAYSMSVILAGRHALVPRE